MLIILGVLLLIISIVLITQKKIIPKKIWTYWNDIDNIPEVVLKCIDTWRIENKDYEITILDSKKILELCDFDLNDLNIERDFYQRHADIARLLIISKFGGIWLDATMICTKPLDWVIDLQRENNVEFIGYFAPHTTNLDIPIVENWFLAAIPESKFITNWLLESLYMTTFANETNYINSIKDNGNIDFQNLEDSLPYLTIHLCGLVILQKRDLYKLHLLDPSDENGPFKYLKKIDENNTLIELFNWDTETVLNDLCSNNNLQTPLIKLRGVERKYIEENKDKIICDKSTNENILHVLG